jgi:nitrogen-specific signal transduction histidine kinase/ActR/RegA family two-component response regulator
MSVIPTEPRATPRASDSIPVISEGGAQQDALRQMQKMEAIGRLAGGVAHDFNNLLTVITGYSDMLRVLLSGQAEAREMVEEISKATERATSLTRQLLAFSRKQILKPRVLDLNGVVRDTEKMLRRLIGEHIELILAPAPVPLLVKVDAGQMEQVVLNLVVNARDAMSNGGKLILGLEQTRLVSAVAGHCSTIPPGDYAVLTVKDTGCGMSAEVRAHLFEPFFTTKAPGKGTGLGLSTVYGITQQSEGHIRVISQPQLGTTFKIYLPLVQAIPAAVVAPVPLEGSSHGSETVLLVEDEDGVRKLARMALEKQGYKVLEARDGVEGLQRCRNHSGPIHAVVTDVVMPFIDGVELVKHLRRRYPAVKALYMSGYTESAVVRHGLIDMTVAFLPKPFTAEELAKALRIVLDQKQPA